tara:strand:- start:353 stop:496 length:144 start_codon:yes stop_codon:yes gene_type:complete
VDAQGNDWDSSTHMERKAAEAAVRSEYKTFHEGAGKSISKSKSMIDV